MPPKRERKRKYKKDDRPFTPDKPPPETATVDIQGFKYSFWLPGADWEQRLLALPPCAYAELREKLGAYMPSDLAGIVTQCASDSVPTDAYEPFDRDVIYKRLNMDPNKYRQKLERLTLVPMSPCAKVPCPCHLPCGLLHLQGFRNFRFFGSHSRRTDALYTKSPTTHMEFGHEHLEGCGQVDCSHPVTVRSSTFCGLVYTWRDLDSSHSLIRYLSRFRFFPRKTWPFEK
jgi:hypothetical protein